MTILERGLIVLNIVIWFAAGIALGVGLAWSESDRAYPKLPLPRISSPFETARNDGAGLFPTVQLGLITLTTNPKEPNHG